MRKQPVRQTERCHSMTATAQILGVSRTTVYRLVWAGELETIDVGTGTKRGLPVVPQTSIDALLERRRASKGAA